MQNRGFATIEAIEALLQATSTIEVGHPQTPSGLTRLSRLCVANPHSTCPDRCLNLQPCDLGSCDSATEPPSRTKIGWLSTDGSFWVLLGFLDSRLPVFIGYRSRSRKVGCNTMWYSYIPHSLFLKHSYKTFGAKKQDKV